MNNVEKNNLQLVKVYVRERPFTQEEFDFKELNVVKSRTSTELVLKAGIGEKKYNFDHVFQPGCKQAEVYDVVVSPLINLVLSGYTCTVFAYGQTGTGKTHTMLGQYVAPNVDFAKDPTVGIVPRTTMHIFDELSKLKVAYSVRVSFVEIYNEEMRDLLVSEGVPLRVYEDPDNKGATCIKGLTEVYVKTTAEVYDLLTLGADERHTASTNLNRLSSRSHTIFTIVVNTRELTAENEEIIKTGKIHLVDLAGSENIARSGATEKRAREAGVINKSLLTLRKVIKSLALKMPHVPYRESKLTRVLQDSLGGKSQTCMIATFAPCMGCFDETVSTLEYAHVARSIANCPTVNISRNQIQDFKGSQEEVTRLRQELNAAREGEGFYMATETYDKINDDIKTRSERVQNLMTQIKHVEEHIAAKKSEYQKLQMSLQESISTTEIIAKKLNEQNNVIRKNEYETNCISGQVSQLNQIASTFINVCETATQREDIYHKKYGTQCDIIMDNATVAEQIAKTFKTYLYETNNYSTRFYNKHEDLLLDSLIHLKMLRNNHEVNLEEIGILSNLIKSSCPNLSVDGLFRDGAYSKSLFQSQLKSFNNHCDHSIMEHAQNMVKAVKDFVQFNEQKHAQVKTLSAVATNSIKEQLAKDEENMTIRDNLLETLNKCIKTRLLQIKNRSHHVRRINNLRAQIIKEEDTRHKILEEESLNLQRTQKTLKELTFRTKKHPIPLLNVKDKFINFREEAKPVMEEVISFTETKLENLREHKSHCLKEIDAYQAKSEKLCADFMEAFDTELKRHHKEREKNLFKCADEVTQIHQSFLDSRKIIEHVANQTTALALAHRTFENDTAQFVQHTSENLRHLQENLNYKVHAGDTPAKPVYHYSRTVGTCLSADLLRKQFETMEEEKEEEKVEVQKRDWVHV